MPDFASSFPLQFLFFSTDQNVDFYSRCCHFFSDIILADLYTHTHTQEQQKCLPTNNNSQNHSSTTAETTDSFCFRWSTMPFGKWYVYHTISFLLFSKIFLFSKRLKFVRVLTFSPLSLSPLSLFLLSITVQESSSVVLDRWYVLVLLLVRSCLCSSWLLLLLALALDISKINLLLLSLKLSLSLSDFNRGSRFTRRHEALGKAHRGREALHLARVGVLCRFGRDRLGKLGRSFHEGDPNPGGTFFVLFFPPLSEREMCASPRNSYSYSLRVLHHANVILTENHSFHRRERSMDSKLPSRTFILVRLFDDRF